VHRLRNPGLAWCVLVVSVAAAASALAFRDRTVRAYTPDNLIRLHVIANSQLSRDQQIKMAVRDVILEHTRGLLATAPSAQVALRRLARQLDEIRLAVSRTVRAHGAPYDARVELGWYVFPPRSYGQVWLPGGRYCALRVALGEGSGSNWWCVLFPPLCLIEEAQEVRESNPTPSADGDIERLVAEWNGSDPLPTQVKFLLLEWIRDSWSRAMEILKHLRARWIAAGPPASID